MFQQNLAYLCKCKLKGSIMVVCGLLSLPAVYFFLTELVEICVFWPMGHCHLFLCYTETLSFLEADCISIEFFGSNNFLLSVKKPWACSLEICSLSYKSHVCPDKHKEREVSVEIAALNAIYYLFG